MTIQARGYQSKRDFIKISHFLKHFYQKHQLASWTIDRLNFTYSVSRIMNNVSEQEWAARIRIWENGDDIVALVISEGENRGEAFLLFDSEPSDSLLKEVFHFVEHHTQRWDSEAGRQQSVVCPVNYAEACLPYLEELGYELDEWAEVDSFLALKGHYAVELPEGFSILNGSQIDRAKYGKAHAEAFGYANSPSYDPKRNTSAFTAMAMTPDYLGELDVCVIDSEGRVCAFVCGWYDALNALVILEPVGTVADMQKMGLGKALVHEVFNRAVAIGATRANVGAEFPFYLSLGFKPEHHYPMYTLKS